MLLSLVIPVYNAEKYVKQCIQSLISQEVLEFEVILVNDGSTDNSLEICEQFAAMNKNIKVFSQKNQGPIEARKTGCLHATGEYVWFIDSDDYLSDGALEKIKKIIDQYQPDIIQFDYKNVDDSGRIIEKVKGNYLEGLYNQKKIIETVWPSMMYTREFYQFGVMPSLWNKVFKKKLISKYIYDVPKEVFFGEDGLVTYQCILKAKSIYFMRDYYLYNYRNNPTSICRTYTLRRLNQNNILLNYYSKLSEFNEESLKSELANYALYMTWIGMKDVFIHLSQTERNCFKHFISFNKIKKKIPVEIIQLFKAQNWKEVSRKNKLLIKWINNCNMSMLWLYLKFQYRNMNL